MDKIYTLTKRGRRVCKDRSLDGDEIRILDYLRENKSASEDQLEIVGGENWKLRNLRRRGLVTEI